MAPKCLQDEKLHMIGANSEGTTPSARNATSYSHSLRSRPGHHVDIAIANGECDQDSSDEEHEKRKIRPLNYQNVYLRSVLVVKHLVNSPQLLLRIGWGGRYGRLLVAMFVIFITFSQRAVRKYRRLFGEHSISGGRYGAKLDHYMIREAMKTGFASKKAIYNNIGIELPRVDRLKHDEVLNIRTKDALRETLTRREDRMVVLSDLETSADEFQRTCIFKNESSLIPSLFGHRHHLGIPNVLFVPEVPSWLQPRPNKMQTYHRLPFTELEMRELIQENFLPLLDTFDSLAAMNDKVQLWALVALYQFGGVYLGNRASIKLNPFEAFNKTAGEGLGDHTASISTCTSPIGVAVFEEKSIFGTNEPSHEIAMLAATPRHPHFRCVLQQLEATHGFDASTVLTSFFLEDSWGSSAFHQDSVAEKPEWEELTTTCSLGTSYYENCCSPPIVAGVKNLPSSPEILQQLELESQVFVQVAHTESNQPVLSTRTATTTVEIRERPGTLLPDPTKKITLESIMKQKRIEPGWLCSRCLKAPMFGSLEKCGKLCPSGYEEFLCRETDYPARTEVLVDVKVTTDWEAVDANAKRIPRIIHQTYLEDITYDRYPNLQRLRNSWLNSGWEYRYYTDDEARKYIMKNYPSRFIDAFDSIIPGAFKADLFRYLVLLKDGGIYADVDMLLDTTLDSFVTPNLSFFAPRDMVGDYANEPFCLWNGLIGAAPGHPFMARAVERLVNLILQRADLYDMERDVCRRVGPSMQHWKLRAEPQLSLSGPCALGIAVNDVLKRPSLTKFEIGWLPSADQDVDYGDALVLVGDKFDLGAFRISDPERSLIVASTELPNLNKDFRQSIHATDAERRLWKTRIRPQPHYSTSVIGHHVYGRVNVYKDDLVNNEDIKFQLAMSDTKTKQ